MAGKQGHLLAGKKKLEEFRKKKAADKAKKDAPPNLREKQSSQPDPVKFTDSNGASVSDEAGTSEGAGISDGVTGVFIEASDLVVSNDYKTTGFALKTDLGSSTNDYNIIKSSEPIQTHEKDEEFSDVSTGPVNIYNSHNEKRLSNRTPVKHADGFGRDQITSVQGSDSRSSKYSNYGLDQTLSNDNHSRSKDFVNAGSPLVPGRFGSIPVQNKSGYSDTSPYSYRDSVSHITDVIEVSSDDAQDSNAVWAHKYNSSSDMGERKFSSSVGHLTSATGPSTFPTESRSTDFNFDARNSLSNHVPVSPAVVGTTNTTRSRPSFLDSINTSKVSSAPSLLAEMQKGESVNSKIHPLKILAPSASQDSMNSFAMDNGYHGFRHEGSESNIENKHNFYLAKQNEDFAALEQHIEDLTHEKFSLQRALEASRSLAESLASENSALTDSYNQQGSVVHQLRSEMEKLQEEIKKHFVEVEAFKGEYANAQMECNAADERAKLLASEVIGLEEKALRLRSSELKLERQLENSEAEISSLRKKISSLEKDRQDLQLTIDALQEEKKLLQSKLRKASATGKLVDVSKSPISKKNVSTSTEDLVDNDVHNNTTPEASNNEIQSIGLLNESDSQYSLEGLSLSVPPDQMRMIQNINTLISELAKEKEELANSLSAASSQSSKLKDLNKELSRKLEVQTQRLELLTAQSMANDNIPARQPDSRIMPENTQYADEGDEVVERVLGWIMKLFPGGPSKRRTSKLL